MDCNYCGSKIPVRKSLNMNKSDDEETCPNCGEEVDIESKFDRPTFL